MLSAKDKNFPECGNQASNYMKTASKMAKTQQKCILKEAWVEFEQVMSIMPKGQSLYRCHVRH